MTASIFRDIQGLGQQVRRHRKALGLSQTDLAARAGLQPRAISRIETAAHEAQVSTLLTVAAALGMDLAFVPRGGVSEGGDTPRIEDIF